MRIAVTGGIAEGKSTVLGVVADLGFDVASADRIAREVFDQPSMQERLSRLLGEPAPIPPELLRRAIGEDPELRRAVNRLMHPEIMSRLRSSPAPFVEAPLLVEACIHTEFDRVWVVTCGVEEQRRRLHDRYGDPATVQRLLATQLPTACKIPFSDLVIRTNQPRETVRRLVSEAVIAIFGS